MSNPWTLKKPARRSERGASVANGLCTALGSSFNHYHSNVTKTVSNVHATDRHWSFNRSSAHRYSLTSGSGIT